ERRDLVSQLPAFGVEDLALPREAMDHLRQEGRQRPAPSNQDSAPTLPTGDLTSRLSSEDVVELPPRHAEHLRHRNGHRKDLPRGHRPGTPPRRVCIMPRMVCEPPFGDPPTRAGAEHRPATRSWHWRLIVLHVVGPTRGSRLAADDLPQCPVTSPSSTRICRRIPPR